MYSERKNSSVDAARVVAQGNVSLTLNRVKVTDEGMHICSVTLGKFQAQQTIQLFVQRTSFTDSTRLHCFSFSKFKVCECFFLFYRTTSGFHLGGEAGPQDSVSAGSPLSLQQILPTQRSGLLFNYPKLMTRGWAGCFFCFVILLSEIVFFVVVVL